MSWQAIASGSTKKGNQMPRASRVYAPGEVFHITHRCHQKEFLLRFKQDRDRYRYWLFEARKRYRFCILNYMITSNHKNQRLVFVLQKGLSFLSTWQYWPMVFIIHCISLDTFIILYHHSFDLHPENLI